MRRREFITLFGGAVTWPLAVGAQQPAMPAVGFLNGLGRNERPNLVDAFRGGLGEVGYVEGRNVAIEYRFAENQPERLPALAADLVERKVAVIAATGGGNAILAAKSSSSTVPIVFTYGGDPVQNGFVASLERPGRNITGVTFFAFELTAKSLGLIHALVPDAAVIALLINPKDAESAHILSDAQNAAQSLGRQLLVLSASTPSEIDTAFATVGKRANALFVSGSPFFTDRRQQIVALATRDAIPAAYTNREFVGEGGLMSYGNDATDLYRRAGRYVGRILKGENAADLPVDRATKFEFVINLKTAKSLGLTVPPSLLTIADEVIE
jgi:putative tryptophan/tyrosine transport system substrate-binding protein